MIKPTNNFGQNQENFEYTLKVEKFIKEKSKFENTLRKEKNERKKTWKLIIVVTSFISVLVFFLLWKNDSELSKLEKEGFNSKAVIRNIVHNFYIMNEMDGNVVNNYNINYEFKNKEGKIINGSYIIKNEDYHLYFENKLKKDDTISILYLLEKPQINIIKKRK